MTTPEMSEREAVARIVDPYAWETFDRQLQGLIAAGLDPDAENGRWMYVKPSLAKADAIIALRARGQPAGDHIADVGNMIPAPTDDYLDCLVKKLEDPDPYVRSGVGTITGLLRRAADAIRALRLQGGGR